MIGENARHEWRVGACRANHRDHQRAAPHQRHRAVRCNITPLPCMNSRKYWSVTTSISRHFAKRSCRRASPWCSRDWSNDWPAVRAARESPRALANFIRGFDRGKAVIVIEGPPSIRGQHFLSRRHDRLQFRAPAGDDQRDARPPARAWRDDPNPPAMFIESMPTENSCPASPPRTRCRWSRRDVAPRIWIGKRSRCRRISTCCTTSPASSAAGGDSRCFRPSRWRTCTWGRSISRPRARPSAWCRCTTPDLARFPRFAEALRHAQSAELDPGDALYIPVRLVASRRVTDAVQRAGELLVERRAEDRLAVRRAAARRAARCATCRRISARCGVRCSSIRIHRSRGSARPPDAGPTRLVRPAARRRACNEVRNILAATFNRPPTSGFARVGVVAESLEVDRKQIDHLVAGRALVVVLAIVQVLRLIAPGQLRQAFEIELAAQRGEVHVDGLETQDRIAQQMAVDCRPAARAASDRATSGDA